ncbi:MAG: preprotein translocase subunit SecG [Candidatus Kerfeldbacteria bacterium RIFCSPLOWO2_01_FULL_48_11]|uniref:Protein-export membrane protein SecG n=1 Tax=Candidatus Kerfeldbacteria bacterium RIFCSPLOWO2_01_FULL_48_11 TaxID=1798543 RepID=A0A1G2B5S4_9BACT|nr:MAG: hypothetical protein UY34_C0010G0083 [Parcubacteria group bacterium GW2011_GWA2_48_9]KKW16544.1 MAG: hypothetical protein UY52_C0003G0040 [Parcubacteria group bacterium GW2011_GWC2_49_9]OGY83969.1 MAG: preprotein translocase subunit SecG [Candidatus Kerfeldbacteria bacterium RIFCSPLOWO2_01_FULL_48_11]HCJ52716.1 preprotein translocase subunit SecG [Candidatus Kerfeldbacteria bacterium]HCM68326.1 preprotein translocase subunit SecG [Candidatus Kerfeldbacteria bacterium]
METIVNGIQFGLAALLTITILLQNKGADAGSIFGGGGGDGNVYTTRRGLERMLFISTIVLSILFMGLAIVNILFI